MLAALDGTERGFAVLRRALDLALVFGVELDLVTVEGVPRPFTCDAAML
jgi:hypothetical protein